ncbi:endonuclease/exonuclease/phosphatase family protein, partial [Trifolium medium]|nr:endonuclease/exonuclease/phosphatase family protein [Trifolium medium]
MKLGWELRSGTDALWCRVLRGKYERGSVFVDEVNAKVNDTSLGKTLVNLWPEFTKHHTVVDDIPEERRQDRVRDLIDEEGRWSENTIAWLPAQLRDNIKAVVPPSADMGSDRCLWPGNSRGDITVSSAYKLLKQDG